LQTPGLMMLQRQIKGFLNRQLGHVRDLWELG
jgi:hypothetical protein